MDRCERCGKKLSEATIDDGDTFCKTCDKQTPKPRGRRVRGPIFDPAIRLRNITQQEAALTRENPDWRVFASANKAKCAWCDRYIDAAHIAARACPTNQGRPYES